MGTKPRPIDLRGELEEPAEPIRCAACLHDITTDAQRIEVDGHHRHSFMNPHGFAFDISIFRRAPGCTHSGERSAEFSWFSGFTWRFSHCLGCATHLGWLFESGHGESFEGLVTNRLQAPPL